MRSARPSVRCVWGRARPAESRNGDPFYWRCLVPDCYTRSLDRPAPRDGLLPCSSCGGPVEVRQMPSGPHWRCTLNLRHRQRVVTHLKLPRMRELIARRDLARLERDLPQRGLFEKKRMQQPEGLPARRRRLARWRLVLPVARRTPKASSSAGSAPRRCRSLRPLQGPRSGKSFPSFSAISWASRRRRRQRTRRTCALASVPITRVSGAS